MQTHVFCLCLALALTVLLGAGCRRSDEMTIEKAISTITSSNSSEKEVDRALTYLDAIEADPVFWVKIASNSELNSDTRRKAVRHFFDRFVHPGMTPVNIYNFASSNVNWISFEKIKPITLLAGWIPLSKFGRALFVVPIMSEDKSNYSLVVYLSFDQDISLDCLVNAFHGRVSSNSVPVILDFACWDSVDAKNRAKR